MPNFRHSKNTEEFVSLHFTRMDYDFIPAFDVNLVAGRNFSEGVDDQYTMIVNVEATQILGFEDPQDAVGYEVTWGNQNIEKAEIVGVVDFRSTSFKHRNYPVAYTSTFFPFKYLSIRFDEINGENVMQNIALAENNWEAVFPDKPFEYFFLDDLFNSHYQAEQRFGELLGVFTLMAIIVACLGLYAIASLTVVQQTQEVGVRKIMGASLKSLLLLLSKNFLLLVLIAGGISLPIIQLVVDRWMENYPYRVEISWWTFLMPIAFILVITALTIGAQIIKAAYVNPSKLLKYE